MEREALLDKRNKILTCLSCLPQKILLLHGRENIMEFVLHDLVQETCFDLKAAAYFVNNPDFNCLKGVTGIAQQEVPQGLWDNIWRQHEMFSTYMRNSPFNRKVRGFNQCSLESSVNPNDEIVHDVARKLGMSRPAFYSLDMKHDNHGFFIFEKNNYNDTTVDELMLNGVSLLGFCPVF